MYASVFRNILFPTYAKIRGKKLLQYLVQYEDHLNWTSDEIAKHQVVQLQALLKHAFESTAYYRRVWADAGLTDPREISSVADFSKLPLVTKSDINENFSEFVSTKHPRNIRKSTGGSTGQPFHFELDHESNSRREAIMWRGYGSLGAGLGTKTLYLWGAELGQMGFTHKLKNNLYHAFYNRKMLNSFAMTEDNLHQYVDAINRYRPEAMVCYVNPLFELARYILESGSPVRSPKVILTGAEPLHEHQRETIQKAFDCPVYNTYGCREFMLIAAECAERRCLHINNDHLLVEAVNEGGEAVLGRSGELVITDLYNYGMPLIRYVNGDAATLTDVRCECGSPLPVMESIEGRRLDIIRTASGRTIPGEFFPHLLKEFQSIRRFQVVQEVLDSVVIKIVADASYSDDIERQIRTEIERYSHGELELRFDYVAEIPLTASGKHRVTVSEL